MNRKRIMKKMLKQFNINLSVDFFTDYAVQFDCDSGQPIKVFVQHPNISPKIINSKVLFASQQWTASFLKTHNVEMSYHAFAMLHEIGHIMSGQRHSDDYQRDVELLEKLFYGNLINEKGYIDLYNNIDDEQKANKWAINWIKNNEKTAKWLNSIVN